MAASMPACDLLASGFGTTAGAICIALALLVLALIALGFGPLRTWLASTPAPEPPRPRLAHGDAGLLAVWRLYRRVGRPAPRHRRRRPVWRGA